MLNCKFFFSIVILKEVYETLISDPARTRQWFLLPLAQAAKYCPCSDCGATTRCYDMNHTIVPVRLPTSGVEKLYLHGNKIAKIYRGDFRELKDLELLTLEKNVIQELDRNAFVGLDNLKTLHLEYNLLTYIPDGMFLNLKNLKNLFLNENKLSKYPGDLPYLGTIEKLNIDDNEIPRIHWSSFINMKKLKMLNLWKNPMDCDCNTKQLIKWLTGTSRGRVIVIPPPPGACVNQYSKATQCDPVKIIKVDHVDRKSNVYIANDKAILHCDVARNLMPYWLTPGAGRVLPYSTGRIEAHINGTLEISNLESGDNGTYTCVAQYVSSSGRKSKKTTIVVAAARKPVVRRPKQVVEIFEGETCTLTCDVTGVPQPTITWLGPSQAKPIDQSNFTEGGNLRLNEDNTTLTISDVKKENQGTWRCRATNSEGTAVGERRLKVMVANDNTTIIIIATVAGIVVVIVAIAIVAVCRKVKRQKKNKESQETKSNVAVKDEDKEKKQEDTSSQILEENDKNNKHETNVSISNKLPAKIPETNIQDKTIKQQVSADTDLELEPSEEPDFVLSFVPGSHELQQPFEYEPEIKGFRL